MFGVSAFKRVWSNRRKRIALYALMTGLVSGGLNLLLPLEDLAIVSRAMLRLHPAPQDIVVVAIDDQTVARFGTSRIPRAADGKLIDTLFDAGANRVLFDRPYNVVSPSEDDTPFVDALRSHKDKVFLAVGPSDQDKDLFTISLEPAEKYKKLSRQMGIQMLNHPFNLMVSFPLQWNTPSGRVPSFAAQLADIDTPPKRSWFLEYISGLPIGVYRADYAIDYRTIPTLSYLDVIEGNFDPAMLKGRDVAVGASADIYRDQHLMAFRGRVPGVHFHVIGAHTLRQGVPIKLSWIPALVLVMLVVISAVQSGRKFNRYRIAAIGVILFAVPLALDGQGFEMEIMPAALASAIAIFRLRARDRMEEATEYNQSSGLPSLQAMRTAHDLPGGSLVALKVRNYGAIIGSFEKPIEASLGNEIVRRVRLTDRTAKIYHEGDRFLWISNITNPLDLVEHLEGLHSLVQKGLLVEDREVDISFNCGVENDLDKPIAQRMANALQAAEQAVHDEELVCVYDPNADDVQWEISLLSALDKAIDNGEVWVAYQPKADLGSGRIKGVEALARWTHPERGPISPEKFITIAEEYHRIDHITKFVLQEAARTAATMRQIEPDFTVSVNISAQMLRNAELPDMISTALARFNLGPESLILEITETDKLDRGSKTYEMMEHLVESGLQLSIDDFGTGNATIDYLRILPAVEVKIDKVFVSSMATNDRDRLLVQSIIEMAHTLDRRVVAEGVETAETMDLLGRLGCDQVQGYFISQPVRFEALFAILRPGQVKISG